MKNQVRTGKVITFAGAIVAYLIGSGYASGQEALQFFASYGVKGCLGSLLLALFIFMWVGSTIMEDGRKLQLDSTNEIFRYYCGKYIGMFFEYYTPIFLFLVVATMFSGAGATLTEYYGLNPQVGRIVMALLASGTVLLGLNGLVNIVSKIGPLVILFGIVIGVASIIMNPSGIAVADSAMKTIDVTKAAPHWYISGVIYASMGCVMLVPFLAGLGKSAISKKEAMLGGVVGGSALVIAISIMAYGLLASIELIYDKDIPSLVIADQIVPIIGAAFSVILFAAIYTTAVPMLWISCNRIISNEKDDKFKLVVLILTIIALVISQLPFAKLINILYPLSGYLGLLLMVCIFRKQLLERKNVHNDSDGLQPGVQK